MSPGHRGELGNPVREFVKVRNRDKRYRSPTSRNKSVGLGKILSYLPCKVWTVPISQISLWQTKGWNQGWDAQKEGPSSGENRETFSCVIRNDGSILSNDTHFQGTLCMLSAFLARLGSGLTKSQKTDEEVHMVTLPAMVALAWKKWRHSTTRDGKEACSSESKQTKGRGIKRYVWDRERLDQRVLYTISMAS